MAVQPDSWPTRKLATVVVGAPTIYAITSDAVREVWPHLVSAALAGEAMTAFIAVLLSTLAAGAVAWLVPDRPNLA
jgi:hypothetical protein